MAAVEITISGVLYDKLNRTTQQVVLVGDASLTGLGIGGGPMPPGQGGGGSPPGIWGGGNVPMPTPPIANVPGAPGYRPPGDHIWGGGNEPFPTPPIWLPPEQVPPGMKPPAPPPAGTTAPVPGNWPTSGMVPPEYVVFNYPGVGPIYVAPPPHAEPAQS